MRGRLILVFTIVPLAELYILIKIGSHIGGFNTILLVLMTTVLGALLARLQSLRTLRQIQLSLSQGQIPAEELIDGVLILFGGILLVMPGVLTDLFALVLLLPLRGHTSNAGCGADSTAWSRAGMSGSTPSDVVKFVESFRSGDRTDVARTASLVAIPGKLAIPGATRNPEI